MVILRRLLVMIEKKNMKIMNNIMTQIWGNIVLEKLLRKGLLQIGILTQLHIHQMKFLWLLMMKTKKIRLFMLKI